MHLILTGATGLVGASALHSMLLQESVTRISILSRRPVAMADGHEKAKVIIHKDFTTYLPALLDELKDAHGVVWALGVSQHAVGKEEYFEITHTYPLSFATAFAAVRPASPFTFVFASGEGATTTPTYFTPHFGRVKGQVEAALLEFAAQNPACKLYNVRPGGVDWTTHSAIQKFIPNQALYKKALVPPLNVVWNSGMIKTEGLGKVLTELAMSDGAKLQGSGVKCNGRLLRNGGMKRMAAL